MRDCGSPIQARRYRNDDFICLGDNFGKCAVAPTESLFECQPALVQVPGPGGEQDTAGAASVRA